VCLSTTLSSAVNIRDRVLLSAVR